MDVWATLVGFALGLGSSEYVEWRRRRIAGREIRKSLIAELKSLEPLLGSTFVRLHFGTDVSKRVVEEFRRWFGGRDLLGSLPEVPPGLQSVPTKSDEEVALLIKRIPSHTEASANDPPPTPVLGAAPQSGPRSFDLPEMAKLEFLNWQFCLLKHAANQVNKFFDMTFTSTEANYQIVTENHQRAKITYCKRIEYVLDALREAMNVIEGKK
jgi:hypothetical protein